MSKAREKAAGAAVPPVAVPPVAVPPVAVPPVADAEKGARGESPADIVAAAVPSPTLGARIAGLLVQEGVIDEASLRRAIRIHQKVPSQRTLLSVLEELGLVNEDQVRDTLRRNPVAVPLGELLVELGYLRDSELRTALALQRERAGSRLGQVLVEARLVREDELCQALSFQLGFEFVQLAPSQADVTLAQGVSPAVLRTHEFLPVERRGDDVLVVFADPLDRRALETARKIFGPTMLVGIAQRGAIEEGIARVESGRTRVQSQVTETVIVGAVNQFIRDAVSRGTSDIHIEPMKDRLRVRFRIDGVLTTYKELPLDMAPAIASRIKILAEADITERRRHQDGRMLFENRGTSVDMRFSSYVTLYGETIVLRLLNSTAKLREIREVGMAPRVQQRFVEDALDAPSGVIIVTGPTGSGKTTTLYASVHYLNNPNTSIITAEDPVEYVVEGISQCSINPKINLTYEDTLKHIVRQDPDVIVIGEIRDTFSAQVAVQASLTGHKVLTTFHTEDSIGGLVRLLNMDIEAFLIASTVTCVMAQRLVRRVCSHCSESQLVTPHQARRLGYDPKELASVRFRLGRGCGQCGFSGYRGRIPIFELLMLNGPVKEALIARRPAFDIRRIAMETTGLVTLLEDGLMRAAAGETSFDEIIRALPRLDKPRGIDELRRLLGEKA